MNTLNQILNYPITVGQALAAVGCAILFVSLVTTSWIVYLIKRKRKQFWVNPLNSDEWNS